MIKKIGLAVLLTSIVGMAFADNVPTTCKPGVPSSSEYYIATQWYNTSAERNAIYREVFYFADQEIRGKVHSEHLKPQQWGVVLDIDDTLLDNSQYTKDNIAHCASFSPESFSLWAIQARAPALAGGVKFTCDVQKMGGYVSLVTNRDGSYVDPKTGETLLQATEKNLKAQGVCFNQVILAKNTSDWNKTPRFHAVVSGNYPKDMVYSNTLPAHRVLAYFGDNVQDMPDLTQTEMDKQDPNGKAYRPFGVKFFSFPNPLYGSWLNNPVNMTSS